MDEYDDWSLLEADPPHIDLRRRVCLSGRTYEVSACGGGHEPVAVRLTGRNAGGFIVTDLRGDVLPHDLLDVADLLQVTLEGVAAATRHDDAWQPSADPEPSGRERPGYLPFGDRPPDDVGGLRSGPQPPGESPWARWGFADLIFDANGDLAADPDTRGDSAADVDASGDLAADPDTRGDPTANVDASGDLAADGDARGNPTLEVDGVAAVDGAGAAEGTGPIDDRAGPPRAGRAGPPHVGRAGPPHAGRAEPAHAGRAEPAHAGRVVRALCGCAAAAKGRDG